jgi:GNAT superfamily N-acetyltransferase
VRTDAQSVVIRPAEPTDEPRLRAIAEASKGHWGYDADLVRDWASDLELADDVWIAWDGDTALGWVSLVRISPEKCELRDLWVDPPAIGGGVGTALFGFARDQAREWGASALRWEAEPHALGFYERMGAITVDEATSSWGRTLPVMQVEL